MQYKYPYLKDEWHYLHPRLRLILCDIEYYSLAYFKVEPTITSIHRFKTVDSGIHSLLLAADMRSHDYTEDQIKKILEDFNDKYVYGVGNDGLEKKVIICHGDGDNRHFHVQVKD